MSVINQAAGFFRFPARVTTRIVFHGAQVVRLEDADSDKARVTFRVRHSEPEPAKGPAAEAGPKIVPVHGPAKRITFRF